MKKLAAGVLLIVSSVAVCRAADIGLIYENEAAVRAGRAVIGTVTSDGILTTAKFALANNTTMLVGVPQDKLRKAILLRLDSKSDLALLQLGDEVAGVEIQKLFQEKAATIVAFLPTVTSSAPSALAAAAPQYVSTDPFYLKINGVVIGSDPVELPVLNGKSDFNLDIVRPSTAPVWHIDLKLSADPKLTFWKTTRQRTLNEIPKSTFTYSQQAMFLPWANGRSTSVSIEANTIKQETYTFLFTIESKVGIFEKKVPVIFKPKK